jgi:hypothetical protein
MAELAPELGALPWSNALPTGRLEELHYRPAHEALVEISRPPGERRDIPMRVQARRVVVVLDNSCLDQLAGPRKQKLRRLVGRFRCLFALDRIQNPLAQADAVRGHLDQLVLCPLREVRDEPFMV